MLIDGRIFIPDFELEWQFVQSPGPGGQNVNKVATSARLTFRLADSVSLPPEIKARLLERLGSRLNAAGELVVVCHESRSQSQNRREAGRKLAELISGALVVRRKRRRQRPSPPCRKIPPFRAEARPFRASFRRRITGQTTEIPLHFNIRRIR